MIELSSKYNDLKKVDNIAEVQGNLKEVKGQMEKNVRSMIDN